MMSMVEDLGCMQCGEVAEEPKGVLGKITYGDASFHIWGDRADGMKDQVFHPIIKALRSIGWKCAPDIEKRKEYGKIFASNSRNCRKGDLHASLEIGGRHLAFETFQNVNAPDRPDHFGRYQYQKEAHMPFILRMEMKRAFLHLERLAMSRGYERGGIVDGRSLKLGSCHHTADEFIRACYQTSWHFKGDVSSYKISLRNSKSAEGGVVSHGSRVWYFDAKGRCCTGTAFYNINNMWWVKTGKYDVRNMGSHNLFLKCPSNPRLKRNEKLRFKVLRSLEERAAKDQRYEDAAKYRDLVNGLEKTEHGVG